MTEVKAEREIGVEYWEGCSMPERPAPWVSACVALPGNYVMLGVYDLDEILILDANTGDERGRIPGFSGVRGLVAGPDGRVIVSEPERKRFSLVEADGGICAQFVLDAVCPWHVAPWGDEWLVVDANARQLYVIDANGRSLRRFVSQQHIKDPRSALPTSDDAFVCCDRGRSVVVEIDRSGCWRWTHGRIGFAGDQEDCLTSAEHVLPLAGGGQMICDTRNNRLLHRSAAGNIRILCGGRGRVGSAPGCLNGPVCSAVAEDGALLIADACSGRLLRLAPDGSERTLWGKPAAKRFLFHFPRSMEPIHDGWLVADSRNNRVVELDRRGVIKGETKEAEGQPFFWPRFATEIAGQRFFCDSRRGRILRKLPDGLLVGFDLHHQGRRIAMSDPHLVRSAMASSVTVSDTDACRLVHASLNGDVLGAWGGCPHYGSTSTLIQGQVMLDVEDLHDGFLAADGSIWLVDTSHHRLLNVDRTGRILRVIQRLRVPRADLADELAWPRTVEPVGRNQLLVTDSGNHRIVLITLDGVLVGVFGGRRGHARGHLSDPRHARYHRDKVLITDYQNHRLLIVSLMHMHFLAAGHLLYNRKQRSHRSQRGWFLGQ